MFVDEAIHITYNESACQEIIEVFNCDGSAKCFIKCTAYMRFAKLQK